jgi:hypothetical protein
MAKKYTVTIECRVIRNVSYELLGVEADTEEGAREKASEMLKDAVFPAPDASGDLVFQEEGPAFCYIEGLTAREDE